MHGRQGDVRVSRLWFYQTEIMGEVEYRKNRKEMGSRPMIRLEKGHQARPHGSEGLR